MQNVQYLKSLANRINQARIQRGHDSGFRRASRRVANSKNDESSLTNKDAVSSFVEKYFQNVNHWSESPEVYHHHVKSSSTVSNFARNLAMAFINNRAHYYEHVYHELEEIDSRYLQSNPKPLASNFAIKRLIDGVVKTENRLIKTIHHGIYSESNFSNANLLLSNEQLGIEKTSNENQYIGFYVGHSKDIIMLKMAKLKKIQAIECIQIPKATNYYVEQVNGLRLLYPAKTGDSQPVFKRFISLPWSHFKTLYHPLDSRREVKTCVNTHDDYRKNSWILQFDLNQLYMIREHLVISQSRWKTEHSINRNMIAELFYNSAGDSFATIFSKSYLYLVACRFSGASTGTDIIFTDDDENVDDFRLINGKNLNFSKSFDVTSVIQTANQRSFVHSDGEYQINFFFRWGPGK